MFAPEANRIMVTGALGQIGTDLVDELRQRYGNENVLATDIRQLSGHSGVTNGPFELLSVLDIDSMDKIVKDYDFNQLGNKLFYPLAFESGKHSRFKLDAQFKEIKFRELYIKWVDNSINKEFADKVFYINQQHKVVGFVTVKKYEKYAKIGLIAIDPNSQGKGYGSILIEQVEKYCIENKLIELQIPTQKENLLACKFYTKLGYSIIKEINIKHFWRL